MRPPCQQPPLHAHWFAHAPGPALSARYSSLPPLELGASGPLLLGGRPEDTEDGIYDLPLVRPLEDGLAAKDLRYNTAACPHVDLACVRVVPKEQLGGPVPERDHRGGVHLGLDAEVTVVVKDACEWLPGRTTGSHHLRQPKVAELDYTLRIQQKVRRFYVAVHHA